MRIFYFDDSGNKVSARDDRYFCLAGFSIEANDLPKLEMLRNSMWEVLPGLGAAGDELKFAHVGMDRDTPKKPNPLFREGMSRAERRAFVIQALNKLMTIPSLEIVGGLVDKHLAFGAPHYAHALKVLIERCEMSLREKSTFGLIICDDENKNQSPMRELLGQGSTEFMRFTRVKETIAFMPSVLSPGVQFADLVAGSIARAANRGDWGYLDVVMPKVRVSNNGKWDGHGIKVFPRGGFPTK